MRASRRYGAAILSGTTFLAASLIAGGPSIAARASDQVPTATRPSTPEASSAVHEAEYDAGAPSRRGEASYPAGTIIHRDVAYGDDPMQKMDVYLPPHPKDAPIILMVHGGGWRRGDKAMSGVVLNKVNHWIPKGYIFISINYRLVPKVTPLQEADDVALALAFTQSKAKSWGGNPAHAILMGHSAGAHLVLLVTANPDIAAKQNAKPWLGTIVLDSGAYDVEAIMNQRHFDLYDTAFGKDRALWQAASPTEQLKGKPRPMLLVCSSGRRREIQHAREFAGKVEALGGRTTLLPVDLNHGQINELVGTAGDYTDAIDAFIQSLENKK